MHHQEYLFAFTAYKTGLITQEQFVMVMTHWLQDKSQSVSSVIQNLGVLSEDELALVDGLVAKQLARHGGNTQKCLSLLSTLGDVESQLIDLNDDELTHRIKTLRESLDEFGSKSTIRFKRISPYAKGALGEVFIAEDAELKRKVALKEIQDKVIGEKSAISRFVREAEVTGQLEHPGIVPVYGLGFYDDGRPFYAMKFIKGESLHEAIKQFHDSYESRRPFDQQNEPLRRLIQRLIDVCNAMHYAHAKGVLHRDLKPDNIMIGKYGETLVVDWGLARVTGQIDSLMETEGEVLNSEEFQIETKAGSMMGTPQYMSPEQAQGELDKLNESSDVYSLGATLYVLLTGKSPLGKVGTLKQFLEKVTKGDIRSSKDINANVPKALDAICRKAMALKQSDRYQSAEELGEDLERWLADQPVLAMRESLPMRVRRWTRQHATLTTSAMVFLATSIVALGSGLIAVDGYRRMAEKDRKNAVISAQAAQTQRKIAEEKREEAEYESKRASRLNLRVVESLEQQLKYAKQAVDEKKRAEEANKELQRQLQRSNALRLVAVANEIRDKNPSISALLSREACLATSTMMPEASTSLRMSLSKVQGFPFVGHSGTVLALVTTPDGKKLISGSGDKTIRIWDPTDSEKRALVLEGHTDSIYSLAITPDGKRLVSGSKDKTIRIWDLTKADPAESAITLSGHEKVVSALAITPDGKRLFSGSWDKTIRIWDLTTDLPVETSALTLKKHVTCLTISSDGKRLIGCGWDRTIRIWDLSASDSLMPEVELRGDWSFPESLAITPDGKNLFSQSTDNSIRAWDLTAPNPADSFIKLRGHTDSISSLIVTHDGKRLLSGSSDKTIRIWDLTVADPSQSPVVLRGHTGPVGCLAISPDGKQLYSGSADETIRIWDLSASELSESTVVLKNHMDRTNSLIFTPDGRQLISGSSDTTIRIWNRSTPNGFRSIAELKGHTDDVVTLAISKDGKRLFSGSWDETIRVWDLAAKDFKNPSHVFRGHTDNVSALAISPDGKQLISGGWDKTIRIWSLSSEYPGKTELVLRGHKDNISSLIVTPDGTRLISGSNDETIRIWDLTAEDPSQSVSILRGHTSDVRSLALTLDGKKLFSGSSDRTIRIWDLTADAPEVPEFILRGHTNVVNSLVVTPDGNTLITGSGDKTIRLWDLTAGNPTESSTILNGHESFVIALAISPDGKHLVSGSYDKTIRIWDLDVEPLIDFARTLAGRELTDEERKIYQVPERVNKRPYKRTTRTYGFRLPFVKE